MTIEIYRIKTGQPGCLFVMPAPRARVLRESVASVRDLGCDEIVSLLTAGDVADLALEDEPLVCTEAGITFTNCAIPDFGLPDLAAFSALTARLAGDLEAGRLIAVHCRAGIGRSGLLACCVLKHFGHSGEEAIAHVSQARRHDVPDNQLQRDFILAYAPHGPDGVSGP